MARKRKWEGDYYFVCWHCSAKWFQKVKGRQRCPRCGVKLKTAGEPLRAPWEKAADDV